MNMKQKIFSLLVLLMTAVTGAWAQTYALEVEDSEHGSGTVTFYIDNEEVTEAKAADEGKTVTMTVTPDAGWLVDTENITAAQLFTNWDVAGARRTAAPDVEIKDSIDVTYVSTDETTGTATFTFTMPAASVRAKAAYLKLSTLTFSPADKTDFFTVQVNGEAATPDENAKIDDVIERNPVTMTTITGYKFRSVEVKQTTDPTTTATVTTNAETTGAAYSEATFDMPGYDATAEYEIVRDMTVQVGVKVGDAEEGADYRIRVRRDGDAWRLADLTHDGLLALITVRDTLESKDLAFYGDEAVCTLNIYAINDNNELAAQPTAFANLAPGRYVAKAVALAGSDYDGRTGISNVIELYYGYEVTIPAGEFITYYKDENLTLDEEDADGKIYTITDVSETTATATELTVAAANTPILVQNTSTEEKTIVLFPTENAGDDVTAYAGFVGTLTRTHVPASTDAKTVYALNGKQFVYVKNALTIGANKAWLEVDNAAARKLTIVFDGNGTTGIADNKRESITNNRYYDLNGRKLNAAPTQKGVYILNGKKVVVR